MKKPKFIHPTEASYRLRQGSPHIMDELEERGYVGKSRGHNKPREILRKLVG